MFTQSAEFYDLIYSGLKNYEAEAEAITALIKRTVPHARRILDVACGTGEHARILSEKYGFRVVGIDIDPHFVNIARKKASFLRFEVADMVAFALEEQYDVVMCLFSSIGYVRTLDRVKKALSCFRRHVRGEGLIIVEPWITPDAWENGKVFMHTAEDEKRKVCRMSYSSAKKRISTVQFEYLIGSSAGLEHRSETHELGLFSVQELHNCFLAVGLEVRYESEGFMGRGLYLARPADS